MQNSSAIKKQLISFRDPERAAFASRFFKTGKGQYGEGDKFLGLTIPTAEVRKYAKLHRALPFSEIQILLASPYHEIRQCALFILVYKFERASAAEQKAIYTFYLENIQYINNWDLVDCSAPHIVGTYLLEQPRKILYRLATSKNLWERRISIIASFAWIRAGDFKDALAISKLLLSDKHDLIHKAVGWMLREIGNRDQKTEEEFLEQHYQTMPRTMLRYAIEKFPPKKRAYYMARPVRL
ncbi:DNA alkylation repair protein [Candidatus Peregrinibacteria bacterium CG11_big_fil_rev_8_21_14_0_20_46_8]|nr:MAG: DNA alkylation repair protein [Candidatus Peregrinibacteria bacterium CG11_big_fil_rev_8_21_14_0_20_46_8]